MADEETPETPAPPALAAGPWQHDIELVFQDPQVRATVDNFLRSKVQPRMTQYEQQLAASKDAMELWKSFEDNPAGTYAAITTQLYGEEVGKAALDALEQRMNNQPTPEEPPVAETPAAPDPRFDEVYKYFEERRAKDQEAEELAAYDAAVAQIAADPANADIVINRKFHQCVADCNGEFDQAIALYREEVARERLEVMNSLGLTEEQLAELHAKQPPPPTLGHEASNGTAPPTALEYRGRDGLNRAIDDVVAQMKAKSQAPPVA